MAAVSSERALSGPSCHWSSKPPAVTVPSSLMDALLLPGRSVVGLMVATISGCRTVWSATVGTMPVCAMWVWLIPSPLGLWPASPGICRSGRMVERHTSSCPATRMRRHPSSGLPGPVSNSHMLVAVSSDGLQTDLCVVGPTADSASWTVVGPASSSCCPVGNGIGNPPPYSICLADALL